MGEQFRIWEDSKQWVFGSVVVPSVAELSLSESELVFPLNQDVVPGWVPFYRR